METKKWIKYGGYEEDVEVGSDREKELKQALLTAGLCMEEYMEGRKQGLYKTEIEKRIESELNNNQLNNQ